jgi:hypothetical protein
MDNNKTFAEGINFKRNDNAPDFVVGKLTIKADAAIQFIEKFSKDNWMNLDIKKAKSGKYYIELDTYQATTQSKPKVEVPEADLPF